MSAVVVANGAPSHDGEVVAGDECIILKRPSGRMTFLLTLAVNLFIF
jgi:hypothetical protein